MTASGGPEAPDELPTLDAAPPTLTAAPEPPEPPTPAKGWRQYESRAAVLGVLFGVTGCLGLPLLIASKKFGKGEKWIWGALNVIYTLALIAGVWWLCLWAWARIQAAGGP